MCEGGSKFNDEDFHRNIIIATLHEKACVKYIKRGDRNLRDKDGVLDLLDEIQDGIEAWSKCPNNPNSKKYKADNNRQRGDKRSRDGSRDDGGRRERHRRHINEDRNRNRDRFRDNHGDRDTRSRERLSPKPSASGVKHSPSASSCAACLDRLGPPCSCFCCSGCCQVPSCLPMMMLRPLLSDQAVDVQLTKLTVAGWLLWPSLLPAYICH